ncbi:DMT family transporter [Egicoccus sp. AB-alg6-2]|uniref:DMT family transporter n=1 Tax=Egicoccus sp. AB-alg6-2 TaxID=3242692 RepID=UPI00359DBC98
MTRSAAPGRLLVLAAATLWGTAGTAQELGPADAWPPAVAGLRSLAGGAVLVVVVLAWRGRGALAQVVRVAPGLLLAAAAAISGFQWAYFTGIRLTGVAVGTLLAIGSAPIWAGVLEAVAGRGPGRRWVAATAITVTGTALLVLGGVDGGRAEVDVDGVGIAAALAAGAAYALYTVVSKRLIDRGADGTCAMAMTFAISGILLAPALLARDLGWAWSGPGMLMLTWLALATIAAAYTLFAAGLRTVDAPTATTLTLAEPLTATVLAVVAVGERLTPAAVAGAALVTAGLGLAGRRRQGPAEPAGARGRIAGER